jgi:hypothetical protein
MLGRGLYVTLLSLVPAVRSLHTVMHVVESMRNLAPLLSLADLPATTLDIAVAAVPKTFVPPEAAAAAPSVFDGFISWVKANPDATRPTSAVWGEFLDKNLYSYTNAAGKLWDNSPLKRDAAAYFSQSTSKATADFFGYISDRAGPNLAPAISFEIDVGSRIGSKWAAEGAKWLDSNPDLKLSTSAYFDKLFGGVAASLDEPVAGLPSLPAIKIEGGSIPGLTVAPIQLPDLNELQSTIGSATSRASISFSTQIAEKAATLQSNTLGGLTATGNAISSVTGDFEKNLPTVLDAASKLPDIISSGLSTKLGEFEKAVNTP